MKNDNWPLFSFTDLLRPPEGWKTDHAILTTYSADLVVVVTALLALTGCDLDHRRAGSRVELVKAIEALRGRVCVLAQAGRIVVPGTPRPILKLLDKFLRTVEHNENERSWHPKLVMIRFCGDEDATDYQWRVWVGSRNLTRAMNWDAGLVVTSRTDGRGRKISGLARLGAAVAARTGLAKLPAADVEAELAALTWECPSGSEVQSIDLFGPEYGRGFPQPAPDTGRVIVVSPFLDSKTVRAVADWGGAKTRRTLVSTASELQRLLMENENVFKGIEQIRIQPFPDLPETGADLLDEEMPANTESAESEDSPAGLHAKLYFAAKGVRRELWIGSANATERGWEGRNFEVVSAVSISRGIADALEEFVDCCEGFKPGAKSISPDDDETAVETARKLLAGQWSLLQRVSDNEVEVVATTPPPLEDSAIQLEVAALGGTWNIWPDDRNCVTLPGLRRWQRSDFLQIRLSRRQRKCEWLQVARCEPPPDDERDQALVAQYLNPRTFLMWLRSLLTNTPAPAGGGDWDQEPPSSRPQAINKKSGSDLGLIPTVEEILRAWARDSSAFASVDKKVNCYLQEIEQRAIECGATADLELLDRFRRTWVSLASELR